MDEGGVVTGQCALMLMAGCERNRGISCPVAFEWRDHRARRKWKSNWIVTGCSFGEQKPVCPRGGVVQQQLWKTASWRTHALMFSHSITPFHFPFVEMVPRTDRVSRWCFSFLHVQTLGRKSLEKSPLHLPLVELFKTDLHSISSRFWLCVEYWSTSATCLKL